MGSVTYHSALSYVLIFLIIRSWEEMKEFAPETPRHLSALIFAVHFCSAVNPGIIKDIIFVKKKKIKKPPPRTPFSISHLSGSAGPSELSTLGRSC